MRKTDRAYSQEADLSFGQSHQVTLYNDGLKKN